MGHEVKRILWQLVGSVWVAAGISVSASAAMPKFASISPPGGQRGATVEVKLSGARLDESPEIVFSELGIQVEKIASAKPGEIKATLAIAPECVMGEHALRVRTSGGVSELRTFWVGACTNIAESEPNNTLEQAQRVPCGVTINGIGGGEDVDLFRVDAKKGERLSAEVEAIRLGRAMLDPHLTIRDQDGKVLAAADDTTLLAQDAFVSILAPRDGSYFVELHESTYSGAASDYRLHIGTFPRPAMIFPPGGKAGQEVAFRFIGDPAGTLTQKVKLPNAPREKLGIFAQTRDGIAPSPNWIRVSSFGNEVEAEPNNTRETATAHSGGLPMAFNGIISTNGDVDWFRFSAKKGEVIEASVYARRLRSPLDSAIEITDAGGTFMASNDDAAGADSITKFTVPKDGDYFLKVRDQFNQGGPDCAYRVEVAPQEPLVTLSIPEVARNDTQSRQFIAVPRGNRFATMITAKRSAFSGELNYSVTNLPAGVKLSSETLPAKLEQEPLVFEATADAPIGGQYVDLAAGTAASSKGASNAVRSTFRHEVEFVPGPNNTHYYSTIESRLLVAVCEAAPFTVRIEEPKAPLVQQGALDLKIIAERRPGFDDTITVRMMWNPPGVSSLPDITIPKGTNAAIYQLNARADAQTNRWKIAVLASSGSERGSTFVSSALTPLLVAEPFVLGTMPTLVVPLGHETNVICKLDQKKPFEGKARVRLLGLPEGITASEAQITSADKEVSIKVKIGDKVAPASYRNVLCMAEVVHNGNVIPHNLASGAVIRVVPMKKEGAKQVAAKK